MSTCLPIKATKEEKKRDEAKTGTMRADKLKMDLDITFPKKYRK